MTYDEAQIDASVQRVRNAFMGISETALGEWRKFLQGNHAIDGKELGRMGLVYRRHNSRNYVLTLAGMNLLPSLPKRRK